MLSYTPMEDYKRLIAGATRRVYDLARKTSLDFATELSRRHHNKIWLKREDQQPVFSYKLRGAYNFMIALSAEERQQGVVAASAGNHAQGVALAAQKLGMNAVIVMPKTTPEIKINAVQRLGAKTFLHGNTYDEAKLHAHAIADAEGRCYVPPYDHPNVIAGQATIAVEILQQHPTRPDVIFVPVGGGGLIAGIVAYLREAAPEVTIIGVEPDEAPCMHAALATNERVMLEHIGIFADGAAVRQAGAEPLRIIKDYVTDIVLVNIDEICAAVKDIFEDTRSIPEPAGALALAGLKQYIARQNIEGRELVAIFSGANVNFDRLRHIAELAALGENREALIAATIPEKPGSFLQYCHDLGPRLITEFNYRYANARQAHVFTGLQLRHGIEEKQAILKALAGKGYAVVDLSSDEVAKMHIRHMVGGHTLGLTDELLCRFEFPERSGALLHFLGQLGGRWNISLFHYRNHGAAYGRVLMGMQVPVGERAAFRAFLNGLGIQYWEESGNSAYELFLASHP